ncbi:MAG: hypothetical protein EA371_13710 [Gammaproteobacteria bacterium]|nr:MAG: hypothetical protein EA371_13710 [Gammaproteobacteria bacterium]
MSIILDALRKSDNERRRQERPGISQLPPAAPSPTMPGWVFVALGVLATLVVVLAVAFWRFAGPAGDGPSATARLAGGEADSPVTAVQARRADPAGGTAERSAAGQSRQEHMTPAVPATTRPLAREIPPAPATAPPRQGERSTSPAVSSPAPTTTATPPADTASDLPSLDELISRGELNLPGLHMDLHVYATDPAQRFVFINGRRLRHGDELAGGVRIVEILADGVILQYDGRRFVLPRD